jgi:hypothetical protein
VNLGWSNVLFYGGTVRTNDFNMMLMPPITLTGRARRPGACVNDTPRTPVVYRRWLAALALNQTGFRPAVFADDKRHVQIRRPDDESWKPDAAIWSASDTFSKVTSRTPPISVEEDRSCTLWFGSVMLRYFKQLATTLFAATPLLSSGIVSILQKRSTHDAVPDVVMGALTTPGNL